MTQEKSAPDHKELVERLRELAVITGDAGLAEVADLIGERLVPALSQIASGEVQGWAAQVLAKAALSEAAGEPAKAPEALGRFGHHPDPAVDFCVEVEALENEWSNIKVGFANGTPPREAIWERVQKAMTFRVGGDDQAVYAKMLLRKVEDEMRAAPASPPEPDPAVQEVERAARELWDSATNAVCQTMQDRDMCKCKPGGCVAATVNPHPVADLYVHRRAILAASTGQGGRPVVWEAAAHFLFGLLDDIDTASDEAKNNDAFYRERVEHLHRRRFEVASTDGYSVTFKAAPDAPAGLDPATAEQANG